MNPYIEDRNEFERESTELTSLLQNIPAFGQRVFRFPYGEERLYYTENPAQVFTGLTGYIGAIPVKKGSDAGLTAYRMKHGERFAEELTHAADYGTFCHMAVATFLTTKELNLNDLRHDFKAYMIETGMPMARFKKYWYRVVNDLKSFAQFAHEKNLEPLATEYVVYSEERGIATPLDIICKMDFNRKQRVCNINLKFRENPGVYEKDVMQTNIEMFMYNDKFAGTEYEIEKTFIWSPVNWRTKPTYKLTDNTGKYTRSDWDADHDIILALKRTGKVDLGATLDSTFTTKTGGVIRLNESVIEENNTVRNFIERKAV